MNANTSEYRPAILNVLAAACVLLISFLVNFRIPFSTETANTIGWVLIGIGMGIVLYAALYIKGAFLGEVEPRLIVLVKEGPYRIVRHPVYLGMTIALAGIPVALRSWLGLIAVLVLFLPSQIYRAKLEERALSKMFGIEWDEYAAQTGFIFPVIQKNKQSDEGLG